MSKTIEVQGQIGQCPICMHPPIRHIDDGTGTTCLVCLSLYSYGTGSGRVCTLKFEFRLSQSEREQAIKADKEMYPQRTTCANCFHYWMQHDGMLCPSGDSTFIPLLEEGFLHTH